MTQADINRRIAHLRRTLTEAADRGEIERELVEPHCTEVRRELESLAELRCLRCGGKLDKTLDPRQVGPTSVPAAVWFNLRCPRCGFHSDLAEQG